MAKINQPSTYHYKKDDTNPPDAVLELEHVYGFRAHDVRNNVKYNLNGELVYHTAAVGIVLEQKKNVQSFFLEHNDDILCIDCFENLAVTGQIGVTPTICVWDTKTMVTKVVLKGILQKGVGQVCFSNDGKKVKNFD